MLRAVPILGRGDRDCQSYRSEYWRFQDLGERSRATIAAHRVARHPDRTGEINWQISRDNGI